MADQETYKAIAARLRRIDSLIEHGQPDKARLMLASLLIILPAPDQRHVDAVTTSEGVEVS